VVQPNNGGTAPAILLSLIHIAQLSPQATVAFFPSDHYLNNDVRFMSHVDSAFVEAQQHSNMIVLIGMKPDSPEVQYGWIEPELTLWYQSPAVFAVRRFWEKPAAIIAPRLMRQGCLWNTFVMIGRADAFLRLIRRALPELYQSFAEIASTLGTPAEQEVLQQLYSLIQPADFSSEVLATWPNYLLVHPVSDVAWCDLGEPGRILSATERSGGDSMPITGRDETKHRASITYLREYFEGLSLSRKDERNEDRSRMRLAVE
jgi:mannose-1-phosphate guanylyltransferase